MDYALRRTASAVAGSAARAVVQLLERGFTAKQAVCLYLVKQRFPWGDADDEMQWRRFQFARWLVEHGRLGDGCDDENG